MNQRRQGSRIELGRACYQRGRLEAVLRAAALASLLVAMTGLPAWGQRGDSARCPRGLSPFSTPFCSELVAVPTLPQVTGMMELQPLRSPFGVSVSSDGRLRHRIILDISGLPRPDSLGAYTRYVAWAYTITMDREIRLGEVRNGHTDVGEIPYEPFRVLVTAEASAMPAHRGAGKLVLRATSPSALLLAHRDAVLAMTGRMTVGGEPIAAGDHMGHDMPGMWSMPPDDPRLAPMAMPHMTPGTPPMLPDTTGRPVTPARPRELVTLHDGDTLTLRAGLVRRTIGSRTFVMYGYNGQYPGPLIRVRQATEVTILFHNDLDLPSTVHWHGLRLENRFDGVPDLTQEAVAPGDSFVYRLRFPDAGIYWYHPHVREDVQQELGLYGNILVARRAQARVPVHREEVVALDDFLAGGAGPVPFGRDVPTYALMGRFGNIYLLNGEPNYTLGVKRGEVVRFYFTNVANARTFNLRIPGARLKLVASDLGDFEREEWVESVVIAPAERYVVEARFDSPGTLPILNSVQWLDHMMGTFTAVDDTLGRVVVSDTAAAPDYRRSFERLRSNPNAARELAPLRRRIPDTPDHQLTLGVRVRNVSPLVMAMMTGMPVLVDWNDGMPMMNWPITGDEVTWFLRDETGKENMDIRWHFRRGDLVKIRLTNDPATLHAMAHPIHFHGQRLAVVSRNGVPNDNLVWKDTALLPAGETMDILLEVTNPGQWMAHCHVAEHLGTGMMLVFDVSS